MTAVGSPPRTHSCQKGWQGEDDEGRPVPCRWCRPWLATGRTGGPTIAVRTSNGRVTITVDAGPHVWLPPGWMLRWTTALGPALRNTDHGSAADGDGHHVTATVAAGQARQLLQLAAELAGGDD